MARAEVPDTSVLIQVMRKRDAWPRFQQAVASGRIWLSPVVVAELYAGTRSPDDAALVDRIVRAMYRAERLLTPTAAEWARAGRLIARRARRFGDVRQRDHLAYALIFVSAARLQGAVLTANVRHFEMWQELAGGLDVAVVAYGN